MHNQPVNLHHYKYLLLVPYGYTNISSIWIYLKCPWMTSDDLLKMETTFTKFQVHTEIYTMTLDDP